MIRADEVEPGYARQSLTPPQHGWPLQPAELPPQTEVGALYRAYLSAGESFTRALESMRAATAAVEDAEALLRRSTVGGPGVDYAAAAAARERLPVLRRRAEEELLAFRRADDGRHRAVTELERTMSETVQLGRHVAYADAAPYERADRRLRTPEVRLRELAGDAYVERIRAERARRRDWQATR